MSKNRPQGTFLNLQQYLSVPRINHTENSNILYLQVMDAVADTKDTMMAMLHKLYTEFIEGQGLQYLVLEGDAKVFDILQCLKHEYGDELSWVLPYPGDWHALKNYQTALIKAYFDAGLKDMTQAAGYPVAQIQSCSQLKRVHRFILEVWETLYRAMLAKYMCTGSNRRCRMQTFSEKQKKNTKDLSIRERQETSAYSHQKESTVCQQNW